MPCPFDDSPFVGTGAVLTSSSGGSFNARYPRISIKGGKFGVVGSDTTVDPETLDVVIVGANPNLSKTWYSKPWGSDGEPSAPECFSLNGIYPDLSIEEPQNDLCATCPQNAWGSRITDTGQQVKACSDQKRLAVVVLSAIDGPIYLLQVTPASLKALNQYQKQLSVRGILPEVVKTKISFDTEARFPKLVFNFGGFLDAESQNIVDKLFGSDQVKEITGEKQRHTGDVDNE
jgi:hypothetical protein